MKKDVPLQTVQRSIEILEILNEDTIGVTELAERLDLPKSTVYDYLRTLRSLGYIIKENRKYRLAFKSLKLGGYRKYHSQLYQLAKPEIKRLADKTGEIVSVNVEEQGSPFRNRIGIITPRTLSRNNDTTPYPCRGESNVSRV